MRPIDTIVFHCSASDDPNADDISVIRSWHLARGFKDVGYHFFIKKDGTIQEGRPLDRIGAHVAGHNTNTVGVCFHGVNNFTKEQMKAIHIVIANIEAAVGKKLKLSSHRDYTRLKTCPNFVLEDFLQGRLIIVKKYGLWPETPEADVCEADEDM
jgi:hypothetical protein